MAYVNVAEWKTEQVCEWLKGLDNSVLPYVHSFTNNKVNGQQLLNLRPEDLEQLGVLKLGHHEIILEAVEYLRNFHYELDRENLQLLALRLSCQAHSLHNELCRQTDSKPVKTQTLSDVVAVVMAVKPLVRWLDRPPFSGQLEYNDKKTDLLKLSIEMSTCAQRDRFAEKPIEEIRDTCGELAKLADYIIQDISDPMILQPACLDLATLKKRPGDDLGFYILPSFHGTHQIAEIKFGSAAHQCGKMEEGDEIVQVNYQTVVGWERKNVLELFNESPAEVLLTLKRRPRHTKVYGQIYIKPYRLPSNKKTSYTTRWQHNLPSPRPELLTIPDFTLPLPRNAPKDPSPKPTSIIATASMLDTMATDSSSSDSEIEPPLSGRLYASKPRSLVQRRATITGASPTTKHAIDIEQFWKELKQEHNTTFQLRDKAASCAHGLDTVPSCLRPQTCLGIEQTKRKKKVGGEPADEKRVQFNEKLCQVGSTQLNESDNCILNEAISSNVEAYNNNNNNNTIIDNALSIQSNNSDITVPSNKCSELSYNNVNDDNEIIHENNIVLNCRKDRGKLDKSHSTPAYDLTDTTLNNFDNNNSVISDYRNELNSNHNSVTDSSSININKTDVNSFVKIVADDINNDVEKINLNINNEIINDDKIVIEQIQQSMETKLILHCDNDIMINFKVPEILCENNTKESINSNDNICEINLIKNHSNNNNHASSEIFNNKSNELIENNIIAGKINELELKNDINIASSRESSEEKSESTSSYMDGICSSSSEVETLKSKQLQMSIYNTDTKNNNKIIENDCSNNSDQLTSVEIQNKELSTSLNPNHSTMNIKDNTQIISQLSEKKIEQIKLKQTPPEPPPRKYFTRPAPLNLNINDNQLDINDCPKVPERPDIKRNTPKDILNEKRSNSETISVPFHQRDYFEGYRDFIGKSTDFIDETPNTPVIGEKKTIQPSTGIDHFGYSEIYEKQLREDKPLFEKYELFTEKFGNSSPTVLTQNPPELPLRMADSPDGAGCSRQAPTPDIKIRTLEKDKHYDKGVVNRAMMVARSIGLHSSSKVSSGSPRGNRKRNMLLAKRRNVSVKDVGLGDLDGWLTYRSRGAGGAWARSWFVLKGSSLYRFKNQDSTKSDCLIALPGFTASQASEVKSRKFAFKVYHTGTVFYFAADNDDNLSLWLDSINKVTLGADSHNRSSGLFSETDESDTESSSSKTKSKGSSTTDTKSSCEKTFGSLKKIVRKDSAVKESNETGGASLDRKYLRFLGARTQNVPVPTAQFRSYRRVLPSSTPRKPESVHNSPDLRVMVAGSTFYGLSSSHSSTDVPNTNQDMSDYRQATDRSQSCRGRRPDDLRGFVTLEEFMLSHQNENRPRAFSNRSASPRLTPINSDHVNIHHRQFEDHNAVYGGNRSFDNGYINNGMIYGHPRNGAESPINSIRNDSIYTRNSDGKTMSEHQVDIIYGQRYENDVTGIRTDEYIKRHSPLSRKSNESAISHVKRIAESAVYYPPKQNETNYRQTIPRECQRDQKSISTYGKKPEYQNRKSEITNSRDFNNISMSQIQSQNDNLNGNRLRDHRPLRESNRNEIAMPPHPLPRRYIKDNVYSGSSGDLSSCTMSETLQRAKKEASISRKGSFNLNDRNVRDHSSLERHWIDSLRRSDKKITIDEKIRLKNAAQYQPPPMPNSPFEQDGMKAAFEMHLDKGNEHVQKVSRLKSLFGSKNTQQKQMTLELTKEPQKTLLGSPRLHRALFRDKSINQRQNCRTSGQSPGDSGFSQSLSTYSGISHSHTLSQSFSSVSSVGDWSPDGPVDCTMAQHRSCHKRPSNANKNSLPPTLPYIPPPTSPPPPDDYPGLEYPPVFEPGTYSLSDASLLRTRSAKNQKDNDE